MKKSNNELHKKKIKGRLFIVGGIIGLAIYTIGAIEEINLGGGFWIVLFSIILILEGLRIRKGKKSRLFNTGAGFR